MCRSAARPSAPSTETPCRAEANGSQVCVSTPVSRVSIAVELQVDTGGEPGVKITKLAGAVAATAITVTVGAARVAPAAAASKIKRFGRQAPLPDPVTGAPTISYTVTGLNPSSDAVPHNGQLYEAPVTVVSPSGAIPMVTMFNARAQSGANYRFIGGGAPGKLYFDVVGDVPNSVVYNDGVQDLLTWIPGPPEGGTRP